MTLATDLGEFLSVASPIFNAGGGLTITALFAFDRILTRGQHLRRMADKDAAHGAEVAELQRHFDELTAVKDRAYGELEGSRDYYRNARIEERTRAEKVTDQLAITTEAATRLAHELVAAYETVEKGARG